MEDMENKNKKHCHHLCVGDEMPDVRFNYYHDGKIKDMSIRDLKGKWSIFFFYPADFTFVCPTELEDLANHYDRFKEEGIEIISFSTDTAYAHKAWHDTSPAISKVNYPMGSDANGCISKNLGIYIDDEGITLRGTFIINPDGIIKSIEVNDNSIGRSAKELIRKVIAAKAVEKNGGKVCPASWEPGQDMLNPSDDLVGKI